MNANHFRAAFMLALCIAACDDVTDTSLAPPAPVRLLLTDAAAAGFAISIDDAIDRIVPGVADAAPALETALHELRAALAARDAQAWQRGINAVNVAIAAVDGDADVALDTEFDAIRMILTHARSAAAVTGMNADCAAFTIENAACE